MSIGAWIILGLVSGFIASSLVSKRGEGFLVDFVLGTVGAVLGGSVFNLLRAPAITELSLWSMLVSVMSAALVLVTYHAVVAREAARSPTSHLGRSIVKRQPTFGKF